jgi:hypothetical protein
VLRARFHGHLDDPGASARWGLLVGLLDDLNLHGLSPLSIKTWVSVCVVCLAEVLDGDVDEPGTQRPLFLVRFLAIVLHDGLSPLEVVA